MGFHDLDEGLCQSCPFQATCVQAQDKLLAQLAADLSVEDLAAQEGKTPAKAAPKTAKAPGPGAFTPDLVGLNPDMASDVTAAVQFICRYCGKPAQKGDPAKWVRGTEGQGKGSAMFHNDCFKKAFNR
jgi:hypothetical protein